MSYTLMIVPVLILKLQHEIEFKTMIVLSAIILFGTYLLETKDDRRERTPRHVMYLRAVWFSVLALSPVAYFLYKSNDMGGSFFGTPFCLLIVYMYFAFAVLFALGMLGHGLITRPMTAGWNWDDLQFFYSTGGDLFFDTLWWPINPDHICTRQSGLQQPDYGNIKVPQEWDCQCLNCGALMPQIEPCWLCGSQAETDVSENEPTVYDEPPDDPHLVDVDIKP